MGRCWGGRTVAEGAEHGEPEASPRLRIVLTMVRVITASNVGHTSSNSSLDGFALSWREALTASLNCAEGMVAGYF